MNQLQVFNYNNAPIQFELIDGQVMANATLMCQAFGKRPVKWLELESVKRYISAIEAKSEIRTLVETRQGGTNPGTWIHEKLILKLAQWLDVDFELWCDERIAELLKTGKAELSPSSGIHVPDFTDPVAAARAWADQTEARRLAEQKAEQNMQLAQRNAHKAAYVDEVLSSESGWTTTTIAKELGVSAQQLNRFLIDKGVQYFIDGHYVLYAKHQHKEYTTTRTYAKDGRTFIQTLWTEKGRAMINYIWRGGLLQERGNQALLNQAHTA